MKKIFYILTSLYILVWGSLKADPIDSLQVIQIQKELAKRLETQMKQNEANDKEGKSHLNNYIIDLKVILKSQSLEYVSVDDGDDIWKINKDNNREVINNEIARFNGRLNVDEVKFYLVIASIYKYSSDVNTVYSDQKLKNGINDNSWKDKSVGYKQYQQKDKSDIKPVLERTILKDFALRFKPTNQPSKTIVDYVVSFYIPHTVGNTTNHLIYHYGYAEAKGISEAHRRNIYKQLNANYKPLLNGQTPNNKKAWILSEIQAVEKAYFSIQLKDPVIYYQYTLNQTGNTGFLIRETLLLEREYLKNPENPIHFVYENEDAEELMRLKYVKDGKTYYQNAITLTTPDFLKTKHYVSLKNQFLGDYGNEYYCSFTNNLANPPKSYNYEYTPSNADVKKLRKKDAFALRMAFDAFPNLSKITLKEKDGSSLVNLSFQGGDIQYYIGCVLNCNNMLPNRANWPYYTKMQGLTGGDLLTFVDFLKEFILTKVSFGLEYFAKDCISPIQNEKEIIMGATWDFAVETGLDALFLPIESYAALTDPQTIEIDDIKEVINKFELSLDGNDCAKLYQGTQITLGVVTIIQKATKILSKGSKIIGEAKRLTNLKQLAKFSKKILSLASKSIKLNINKEKDCISPKGSGVCLAEILYVNDKTILAIDEQYLATTLSENYEFVVKFDASEVDIKKMSQTSSVIDFPSPVESIELYRYGNVYKWLLEPWRQLYQLLINVGLKKDESFVKGLYVWLREQKNLNISDLVNNTKSQWLTLFTEYTTYQRETETMTSKYSYLLDKNNVEVIELMKNRNMQDVFVKQSYSESQSVQIVAGELADYIAKKELLVHANYGKKYQLLSGIEMYDKSTQKSMGEIDMMWLNNDKTIKYLQEVKGTENSKAGLAMEQLIVRKNNLALYKADPSNYILKIWDNGAWKELPSNAINISQTNIESITLESVGAKNHTDYTVYLGYTSNWLTTFASNFYNTHK